MNNIIKPNNYNPIISSNSVIKSQPSVQDYKEKYLKIQKYLSEFKTQAEKQEARKNLDVYSKDETDSKLNQIRTDLGQRDDSPNEAGNAFERINYLLEVISELLGEGNESIAGQIKDAIDNLKGGVSTEYDTLKKIEDIIKSHLQNFNNPHQVTYKQVGAIPVGGLKTINGNELEGEGDIIIRQDANDVFFTNDLVITADVGVHTIGPSGSKTLPTTGKSIKQVMDLLFAEEKNPTITQPSVNLTSTSMGAKEVGTRLIPNYTASLNPGTYQYGPDTGVTAILWKVTDTTGGVKDTNQGNFSELLVTDNTNYSITASVEHTEGTIPLTNLGNPYPEGKIQASNGTPKTKTLGSITGYRNTFYGTVTNKGEITSSIVRGLTKSNKTLSNGSTFNVSIPIGALRVIIAYPASLRDLNAVLDVDGLNANITSSFKKLKMDVLGNNDYTAIQYKVYYLDYAEPYNKNNTYKVTI